MGASSDLKDLALNVGRHSNVAWERRLDIGMSTHVDPAPALRHRMTIQDFGHVMNLRNPKVLYLKAGLFLVIGVLAGGLILVEHPSVRVAILLVLAIWAFARAYYFVFYAIQHYVDDRYRFSGMGSFIRYLLRRGRGDQ